MQTIGQVVQCGHCAGKGICSCSDCQKKANTGLSWSSIGSVKCSACGGKGSVWIGPDAVTINNYNSPN